MKVVIIEDERFTAEDLRVNIEELRPYYEILEILDSVKSAKLYLQKKPGLDLIFSDIQLGDGLSFEIFAAIPPSAPVIFCTAFDQYAIQAFKANGIEYLLKPFNKKQIEEAVLKFENLTQKETDSSVQINKLFQLFAKQVDTPKPGSILVRIKDKIIPIPFEESALFYIKNEVSYLVDFKGNSFPIDKKLEELELLNLSNFYRANRQFLVNRLAIKDARIYLARKLLVTLKVSFSEQILVSKEKSSAFLKWLECGV